MGESLYIRPAQPSDAEVAAALLYSAYTHRQVTYPLEGDDDQGWVAHLERFFREDGNRFSYQNAQVAAYDSEVVGLVLGFSGHDEKHLNAAVGSWLEREAADDEWYIDALAVFTNWGRRGIGARLMYAAEPLARQRHYPKMALHVAPDNAVALGLYERLGYAVAGQVVLYARPYLRMEKTLEPGEPGIGGGVRAEESDGRSG